MKTELEKAVTRWVEAKRQQILREDTKGDLALEVRKQERDVEDEIAAELEAMTKDEYLNSLQARGQ